MKELKMMIKLIFSKRITLNIFLLFLFISSTIYSQDRGFTRVMFYNAENLFDTVDDPETIDEEFLPTGERHWTNYRLNNKIQKLAKVFMAVGGWEAPEIIGICEVENRVVLEQLISHTQLKNLNYQIIHKQSPDRRGIDVALFYRKDKIRPVNYEYLEVNDKKNPDFKTREILYFAGIVEEIDTIHVFVNHWPSRYGGLLETVDKRGLAANVLKRKIKLLQKEYNSPKIIVMGDFNDQPTDKSLVEVLEAKMKLDSIHLDQMYNLSTQWMESSLGTLKYQSQWSVFDQFIVSGALLGTDKGIYCSPKDAHIFSSPFLLEEDKTHHGIKPNRTYVGFAYNGGFSDHLPVYIDLWKN